MKRFLALVCGSLMVFLLFFTPGNVVQAEEDCGCPGTVVTGAERNKLVADLLKSEVFKSAKKDLIKSGYKWTGAGEIEIRDFTSLYNLEASEIIQIFHIINEYPRYEEAITLDTPELLALLKLPPLGYQVVFQDKQGEKVGVGFGIFNGVIKSIGEEPAPIIEH